MTRASSQCSSPRLSSPQRTSPQHATGRCARRPTALRQRGFSLLDGLVGMTLMAVGLLGLARLESGLIAQSTEAQSRLAAAQLSDQLLSTVLVDVGNATCYTVPATGSCGSDTAKSTATAWRSQALAALPGATAASAVLNTTTQRMTVTLQWTGKTTNDTHTLEAATDVR